MLFPGVKRRCTYGNKDKDLLFKKEKRKGKERQRILYIKNIPSAGQNLLTGNEIVFC